ncbi:MAG: PadR family transcriptional regulator [Malacoplasma sp.]
MIKLAILGFLSIRPASGYELDKKIHSSLSFFWKINQAQIYMELNRLESENKIVANLVVQDSRPNKKIYSLTKKGQEELTILLNPKNHSNSFKIKKIPFLVWTFFGFLNSRERSIEYLNNFQASISIEIEAIEFQKSHIQKLEGLELQKIYWLSTTDFGIEHYKKMYDWADNLIKEINNFYDNKNK